MKLIPEHNINIELCLCKLKNNKLLRAASICCGEFAFDCILMEFPFSKTPSHLIRRIASEEV